MKEWKYFKTPKASEEVHAYHIVILNLDEDWENKMLSSLAHKLKKI